MDFKCLFIPEELTWLGSFYPNQVALLSHMSLHFYLNIAQQQLQ